MVRNEFIPPNPDEPVPTTPAGVATDAGLNGFDVTEEYFSSADASIRPFLSMAQDPTWPVILFFAKSFLGDKPPGWVRENVNFFTKAFYGNSTKAAWCLIFVWYVLSQFGLASWKLAYVPWLYKIPGEHDGHSGIQVGAICAINRFGHVGFFVADHGDEFDLLSGNSEKRLASGQILTDAITVKRYRKSVIAGYANVPYPAAQGADDRLWFAGGN